MAARTARKIDAGDFEQQVFGRLDGAAGQGRIEVEKLAASSQQVFFSGPRSG
jgi:hypothetical protein